MTPRAVHPIDSRAARTHRGGDAVGWELRPGPLLVPRTKVHGPGASTYGRPRPAPETPTCVCVSKFPSSYRGPARQLGSACKDPVFQAPSCPLRMARGLTRKFSGDSSGHNYPQDGTRAGCTGGLVPKAQDSITSQRLTGDACTRVCQRVGVLVCAGVSLCTVSISSWSGLHRTEDFAPGSRKVCKGRRQH